MVGVTNRFYSEQQVIAAAKSAIKNSLTSRQAERRFGIGRVKIGEKIKEIMARRELKELLKPERAESHKPHHHKKEGEHSRKKSHRLSSTTAAAKNTTQHTKRSTSHPCFVCGLMFAKKSDYDWHELIFHSSGGDDSALTLCDQCGKSLEFDADSNTACLGRHQLEHDFAALFKALYEQELSLFVESQSKQKQPIAESRPDSPFVEIKQDIRKIMKKVEPVVSQSRESPEPVAVPTQKSEKNTQEENTYKDEEMAENTTQEVEQIDFSPRNQQNVPPQSQQEARLQNNSTGSSADRPSSDQIDESAATPMLLQSTCPHCGKNEGKPWLLIDHMIREHDAKLIGLERKLTASGGSLISFENFESARSKCVCKYCGEKFKEKRRPCKLNSGEAIESASESGFRLLAHISSQHRKHLFDCPEFTNCDIRFDVLATIGEHKMRKFTIRVKISRKPKT